MTAGATPKEHAAPSTAAFEVARFEWSGDGRIEVEGAWSGVRGRRFVRPTLELGAPGERRRLLAVLDHKPWDPSEGDAWLAAFPWEGDPIDVDQARLHVAPGVDVELPPPAPAGTGGLTEPMRVEAAAMKRAPGKRTPKPPVAKTETDTDTATQPIVEVPAEAEPEPAVDIARVVELEARVAALERERDAALAQRRATSQELEDLRQAQERALSEARAEEREKAGLELAEGAELRARIEHERDEAFSVRDSALAERDDAQAAKAEALHDRKQALADRKAALRERDAAQRERDKALAEARRSLAARNEAMEERDHANALAEAAQRERDSVVSVHERGLPLRAPQPRFMPMQRARDEVDVLMGRAIAILIVGIFLIVVLRVFL